MAQNHKDKALAYALLPNGIDTVPIRINADGKLLVDAEVTATTTEESVGTPGSAPPAKATYVGAKDTLNNLLVALVADALGKLIVRDDYQADESLEDQVGDGTAKTFTFVNGAVSLVVVTCRGGVGRAAVSETPTASKGHLCLEDAPQYIPVTTSAIKVFAAGGVTISVVGMRRA